MTPRTSLLPSKCICFRELISSHQVATFSKEPKRLTVRSSAHRGRIPHEEVLCSRNSLP